MRTASEVVSERGGAAPNIIVAGHGDEELGRKLFEFRDSHGLTLREVAGETGLSVAFLSQLETARGLPGLGTLATLAAFYETGLDELAGHMVKANRNDEGGS